MLPAAIRQALVTVAAGLVAVACSRRAPETVVDAGPVRWLKGQTHLHSDRSGDSRTPPAQVVAWYARHGYDFIVFTDHNHVTPLSGDVGGLLVIPGVELTQNLRACDPAPPAGMACLLHVNALFVRPDADADDFEPASSGSSRRAVFRRALDAAAELGGLAQLNHPNFHYAADGALLARLATDGATFLEIANEAWDSNNGGDATHPSTEALWDEVLSSGVTLWGVATDDAHHYDDAGAVRAAGEDAFPGNLGWVMVRARRDPASIRDAMVRGDFHASTGVLLDRAEVVDGRLHVAVRVESGRSYRIDVVGVGGRLLAATEDTGVSRELPAEGYVRVRVTDDLGRRAWTQPFRRSPVR